MFSEGHWQTRELQITADFTRHPWQHLNSLKEADVPGVKIHLESLVRLSSLQLLADLNSSDGNEGQTNQNEDKNNTSWKHFKKV